MSGKFLARATAVSLTLLLAACGGDENSTPFVNVNSDGGSGGGTGTTGTDNTDNTDNTSGDTATSLALGTGQDDSFIEGQISAGSTDLTAGGQTTLAVSAVNILNGNALMAGQETTISFTSSCIDAGEAIVNTPISTTSGLVEVNYQAQGCTGTDTVTATAGDGSQAQVTLSVAPAFAFNLIANEPEPNSIAPSGLATSARPSSSTVSFEVVDEEGNPVRGADVSFRLSYSERANASAEDARLDALSATSGAGGLVTTRVIAGSQHTVVRIIASVTRENGESADTTSLPIAINAFVPDQDSFSISVDNFMPNAQFHNNETINITVNAGDRFNNNDLDLQGNTVVSFATTGGSIDNSCVLNADGTCTVAWRSSDPRPASGRVAILARSVGEESFRDLNSNDEFDNGEFVSDASIILERGEAYLDFSTNNNFDQGTDQFFDYNGNGVFDTEDGVYDGSACLDSAVNNCSRGPVTIWDQAFIVMASDRGITANLAPGVEPNEFCLTTNATTQAGQPVPLPASTTITFSIDDGEIFSTNTSFSVDTIYLENNTITECVLAGQNDDLTTTPILKATITPPAPFSGRPVETSLSLTP